MAKIAKQIFWLVFWAFLCQTQVTAILTLLDLFIGTSVFLQFVSLYFFGKDDYIPVVWTMDKIKARRKQKVWMAKECRKILVF